MSAGGYISAQPHALQCMWFFVKRKQDAAETIQQTWDYTGPLLFSGSETKDCIN